MNGRASAASLTITLMLIVAIVGACGDETEPTPPIEIAVGTHRISLLVPEGWQHQDRGRSHRFEQGSAFLIVSDLGPATRDGLVTALRQSRALYDAGQREDASVVLTEIDPHWFFTTRDRWDAVEPAWQALATRNMAAPPEPRVVQSAYRFVLAQAEALLDPDFAAISHTYLGDLGHTSQRDIAREIATSVSGRPALRIETWDRLTHLWKRQYLFVMSDGRLLCLRTELGDTAALDAAFEALTASMAYLDAATSGIGS